MNRVLYFSLQLYTHCPICRDLNRDFCGMPLKVAHGVARGSSPN